MEGGVIKISFSGDTCGHNVLLPVEAQWAPRGNLLGHAEICGVSTIDFPNACTTHGKSVVQIRLREYLAHPAAPARQNLLRAFSLKLS
jgi:hypothetical protein